MTTAAEDREAEIEAKREQMQEMWTQIKGFLEDGVITSDEIAQLPADNPFSNLESILADGQITLEELQSVGSFGGPLFGPGGGHGRGDHFGPGGPGWVLPPPDGSEDSTAPSTDTGSDSDASNS
jgi:hypothetical protein